MNKFRLRDKCGTHTEAAIKDGVSGIYFVQPGNVVLGNTDLSKRFPEKFDKVGDDARVTAVFIANAADGGQQTLAHAPIAEEINRADNPVIATNDKQDGPSKDDLNTFETIKEMSAAEVKAYAAENEIDIGEARTKKEILEVIAEYMGIITE